MTNPGNAVGTPAAYNGRTSVNAFSDWGNAYSRGIVSGWACQPSTGMTVTVGGVAGVRDVASAENNIGAKTTINNISQSPVSVTLEAALTSSQRLDSIVAYVDASPQGDGETSDNPSACGLIAVSGSSTSYPDETTIRTAITADGASGSTAYYVVLANVAVAANTTDITSDMITQGTFAQLATQNIDFTTLTDDEINTILLNAPVASTTSAGPYGLTINLQRLGNLVFYRIYAFPTSSMVATGTSNEAIPYGYRPTSASASVGRAGWLVGEWLIYTNGTCFWTFSAAPGTDGVITVDTVYFTDDDYPS